jgi:hypothetical protein
VCGRQSTTCCTGRADLSSAGGRLSRVVRQAHARTRGVGYAYRRELVVAVVTEIATLRGELFGPNVG